MAGRGWLPAGQLRAGDELLSLDGTPVTVQAVSEQSGEVVVYNVTVEGLHTYFAGTSRVLVHNCPIDGGGGNVTKRTFTSSDKHVGDVANAIEEAYPGHVVGVNVPVRDAAGNMVTDADILLKNAVIQVKSGGGKGMTSQIQRTEQATGLPTIGYGPDLKQSILKNSTSTNDLQLLIDVVKP